MCLVSLLQTSFFSTFMLINRVFIISLSLLLYSFLGIFTFLREGVSCADPVKDTVARQ
jgi:hypothetical protein